MAGDSSKKKEVVQSRRDFVKGSVTTGAILGSALLLSPKVTWAFKEDKPPKSPKNKDGKKCEVPADLQKQLEANIKAMETKLKKLSKKLKKGEACDNEGLQQLSTQLSVGQSMGASW
ncbi:MAG: twin-arginine translocation signal domain-containing protein [Myxococcota bacterium]